MGDGPEATYKIGNATVRIHGKIDPDKLKAATVEFLKSAERQKKDHRERTCRERSINGNSNSIYDLYVLVSMIICFVFSKTKIGKKTMKWMLDKLTMK